MLVGALKMENLEKVLNPLLLSGLIFFLHRLLKQVDKTIELVIQLNTRVTILEHDHAKNREE